MAAFEVLVRANLSQEVMRSLTLFITHAFHSPPVSLPRTPKPPPNLTRTSMANLRKPVNVNADVNSTSGQKYSSKKTLGVKILVMYSGILCEKGNLSHIKKFARTVTNKVSLYSADLSREPGDTDCK